MEISTSVAVMQCLLATGAKEESRGSKTIYIALVTPESIHAGLILPQSPTEGPTYHGRRATPQLPHDDMLHPPEGDCGVTRAIYIVFDSLLPSLSPVANRHCITATNVEISTS